MAVRDDPEEKKALAAMKKFNPDMWRARVRAMRISMTGPVQTTADRHRAIATFRQELRQFVTVEEEVPILWLNQGRFIAHYKTVENYSEAAAQARWEEDLSNPDVQRRGQGKGLELGVLGVCQSKMRRGRTYERSVRHEAELQTQTAAEQATRRVLSVGNGPAGSQAELGGLTDAFRVGAASAPPTVDASLGWGQAAIGPETAAASTATVVPADHFSPAPAAGPQTSGRRSLASGLSDPREPAGPPAKRGRPNKDGISAELKQARQSALECVREVHNKYGTARFNLAARLKQLVGQLKMPEDSHQADCDRYQQLVDAIAARKDGISSWTADQAAADSRALSGEVQELEALAERMDATCTDLKTRWQAQTTAAKKATRQANSVRDRALKVFIQQGCPNNLAKFLWQIKVVTDGKAKPEAPAPKPRRHRSPRAVAAAGTLGCASSQCQLNGRAGQTTGRADDTGSQPHSSRYDRTVRC